MKNQLIFLVIVSTFGWGPLLLNSPEEEKTYQYNTASEAVVWTDPRDGQQYATMEIEGVTWMIDNYNFERAENDGWLYNEDQPDYQMLKAESGWDSPSFQKMNGRLYSYQAAKALAPEGWRLPTSEEWEKLRAFMRWNGGSSSLLDDSLYERTKAVNLLSGGQRDVVLGMRGIGQEGVYWAESGDILDNATYYKSQKRQFKMESGTANIHNGYSVRYIRK